MMGNFLSIITKYAKTMVDSIYHKVENFKALFQQFLKQLQHSFGRKSATKPDIDPQWEISGSLSDNNSSDHEVTIDFHDHRIVPLPPSKTRYLTFHGVKTGCDGIPEAMELAAAGFYYNDVDQAIQCSRCGMAVRVWDASPEEVHRQLMPTCI